MKYSTELQIRELSEKKFPQAWKVVEKGVADGVAPGCVAGLWQLKNPDEIFVMARGQRRVVPTSLPMLPETVFDLASVTKVFATATLAAVLVDKGWLSWETPISTLLTGYRYPEIQIRHLLSHTAGFIAWEPFWEKIRDYFAPEPLYAVSIEDRQRLARDLVCATSPERPVGEHTLYSDLSFILLGFALEKVTDMPLDKAVKRFVWEPMGIQGAFFRHIDRPPTVGVLESVAATEESTWRGGVLQGQVHDDNCWAMGGFGGHAGAFGSIRDVLHFSRCLLTQKIVTAPTLEQMWTRLPAPNGDRTLGWDTPSGETPAVGKYFSAKTVGHLGYTGTSLWIDPEAGLAVALLSNRVHPSRENNQIKVFRPLFHEAIREDLGFMGAAPS